MKRAINPTQLMFDEEFESKHPRQENGKFGAKGEANNIDNKTIYDATSKIRQKFIKTKNPEVIQEFNELVKNKEKEFYATNPDNWEKLTFEINMVKEKAIFSMTNIKMWLEAGNEPVDISQSIEKLLASTVLDKSLTKMQKGYKKSTFDSLLKQLGLYPGGKDKTVKRIVTVMKTRISSYAKYAPDEWKMGDILEKFFAKENGGSVNFDEIHIDGYTKSDGTEVSPHTRHIDGTKSATQAADMGSEYREVKLKGWDSKALDDIFTNINDNYDEWKASGFTPTEAYQLLDSEVGKYEDDGETIISPDFAIEMKEAGYEVDEIIDAVEEARKDYNDDDYQIIMDKAQEILDKKEKNIVTENIEDDIDVDDLTAVYVEKLDPSYQSVFKSEIDDLFTDKGDDAVEEYVKQVKTYQREKLPPVFAMRALLADKPAKTAKAIYDMVQESEFTVDWHDDLECAHFFRMINKFRDYSDKGGKFSEIVKLKHKVTGEVFFAEYGSADELREKGLIPVKRKSSKDGKGEYFGRKKRAVKIARAMKKVKDVQKTKEKPIKAVKREVKQPKGNIKQQEYEDILTQLFGKSKLGGEKVEGLEINALSGKKAKYKHPVGVSEKSEYPIDYVLVDMSELKTSHNPSKRFAMRDGYPSEIQDRDYEKESEKAKVIDIASKLDPDFMLSDALSAQEGAPIITKDGVVLSGNGRTMGLMLSKEQFPEQFNKYEQSLKDNLLKFGFLPKDVEGMKNPVLVRLVDIDSKSQEAIDFGISANSKMSASRSEIREAASFARNMPDELFTTLRNVDESSMSSILDKKSFVDFIKAHVPIKEQKSFINETTRRLSDSGKALVKRIMLLKVMDKPEVLESMTPGQYRMYENAIPTLIDVKLREQKGDIDKKHYNVLNTMKKALSFYNENVLNRGYDSYEHYQKQKEMFEDKKKPDKTTENMMLKLESINKPNHFKAFVNNLAKLSAEESSFTSGMLGVKPREFNELITEANQKYIDEENTKKAEAAAKKKKDAEIAAKKEKESKNQMFSENKRNPIKLTDTEKQEIKLALGKTIKTENDLKRKLAEIIKKRGSVKMSEQVIICHKQTNEIFFAEYGSREDLLKKGLVPIKRKANTDNKGEYYGRKKKSVKPGSASGNKKFSKLMLEKIKNTPAKQLPNVLRNLDPKTKAQVSKVLAGNNKATNKKTPSPKVKKMTNKERGFSMKPPAKKIPRENTVKKMTDKERGFSLGIPEAQKAKAQSSALKKVAKVLGKPLEYLAKKAGKKLFSILDRMIVIHGWMQRRIDRTEEIRKRDMGKNYGKPIEQNKLGAAFNRGVGKRAGEKGAGKRYVPGKNLKLVQNFSEQNTDEIKLVIVEYLKNLGIEDAENKANKILKSKVMQKHFPKGSVSMAEGKRIDNLTTKDWIKEFLNKDMYRKSIKPVLLAEFTNGSELLFDKNYYIQKDKEKTQLTDNQTINKIKSSIKTNDIKPYSEILKKLIQSIKEGKTSSNRAVSEQRAAKQGNINFTEGQTVILRNKVTNEVFFAEIYKDKSAVPKEKVAVRISRGKNAGKYYGRARKAAKLADAMVKAKKAEKKQPWEMTKEEFLKKSWGEDHGEITAGLNDPIGTGGGGYRVLGENKAARETEHKQYISDALSKGKTVPESVLKEYPDLKVKPKKRSSKKDFLSKVTDSISQSKQSPKPVKAEKKSTKPKRKIYDSADAVPEGMTAVKIGRGDNEGKYYARKGGKKKDAVKKDKPVKQAPAKKVKEKKEKGNANTKNITSWHDMSDKVDKELSDKFVYAGQKYHGFDNSSQYFTALQKEARSEANNYIKDVRKLTRDDLVKMSAEEKAKLKTEAESYGMSNVFSGFMNGEYIKHPHTSENKVVKAKDYEKQSKEDSEKRKKEHEEFKKQQKTPEAEYWGKRLDLEDKLESAKTETEKSKIGQKLKELKNPLD